jgi:excisionase family DNA binding protein
MSRVPESNVPPMLLTSQQAAGSLQLSVRTLQTYTRAGLIPAVRIGKSVRYNPRVLAQWLDSNPQCPVIAAGMEE